MSLLMAGIVFFGQATPAGPITSQRRLAQKWSSPMQLNGSFLQIRSKALFFNSVKTKPRLMFFIPTPFSILRSFT